MTSPVYFADLRIKAHEDNVATRIRKLFEATKVDETISKGDLVAIKTHFGMTGNDRHVRPEHLREIVEKVREAGGQPFVTDTTGIGLLGDRGTAAALLTSAARRGFTEEILGAPIIVADAPKGLSGVRVEVKGAKMKYVELAQAIADCDALISVARAKGHPRVGFAGALKNIGVGCVSKCGRAPLHLAKKPTIHQDRCNACGLCVDFCPVRAIQLKHTKPQVIQERCIWGCGCWNICPKKAFAAWSELHHPTNRELAIRLIDAAAAVVSHVGKNKVSFFNLAYEITPHCDCASYSDVPMVPDIGIFASRDPVAIDKACSDAIIASPGIPGSAAEELGVMNPGDDKLAALGNWPPFERFRTVDRTKDWKLQFKAAVNLGLGSIKYKLLKV